MGIELARTRLRGIYAMVAGAMLLIGVPALESVSLAASGYLTAVDATARGGSFEPLLAWIAANSGLDGGFRLFELVPFLLAVTLPGTLAHVLWPAPSVGSRVTLWAGRIGFAAYAVAIIMGIVSSKSSSFDYTHATTPAGRAAVALGFAHAFAAQNLLAHVLGGLLVTVALGTIAARIVRRSAPPVAQPGRSPHAPMPLVVGFLAVLAAVLLAVTALEYAARPARVEAPTSALGFATLALWLVATGIVLWQGRDGSAPSAGSTASPTAQDVVVEADADAAADSQKQSPRRAHGAPAAPPS